MTPYLDLGAPKWDKGLLLDLLHGELAAGGHEFEKKATMPVGGAVLLVPVGVASDDISLEVLQAQLDRLTWAVVLATSDEGSTFPWRELTHPNMRLWIQTPRPSLHSGHDRFLVHGIPAMTTPLLRDGPPEKTCDWIFAGQVNHKRRARMAEHLRRMNSDNAILLETGGFSQGFPRDEYLAALQFSKIAICPPGPLTPDSFRLWESLEAGCVPIVDQYCPAYNDGEYWPFVLGENPPFPIIGDWSKVAGVIQDELAKWPLNATRASAWWQQHKHRLHWRINDDVTEVSGIEAPVGPVTILIPTSPIPAHPSTEIVEETVRSARFWYPDAEIIVMCDGVRPEQEHHRERYEEYLNRLMFLCEHRWGDVVPLVFERHEHQARMTRAAMELVRAPLVLFLEHDCPLVTDWEFDWEGIENLLLSGQVNLMRFHYESYILEVHEHMMIDHSTIDMMGVPCRRTFQWSQRPHLARSDFYRHILDRHFKRDARSMIEDRMCSVVTTNPWGATRLVMYTPPGIIKRSYTTDGRGEDEKFESDLT